MIKYMWVLDKDKEVLLNTDFIKELYVEKVEDKELYEVIIVLKDGEIRKMTDPFDDIHEAEAEMDFFFM